MPAVFRYDVGHFLKPTDSILFE